MGTSLALTGAYVLAGELAHHAHHRNAFARYEHILRPYVTRAQHLPPGVPRIASPRTRAGIHATLSCAPPPGPASPEPSTVSTYRLPSRSRCLHTASSGHGTLLGQRKRPLSALRSPHPHRIVASRPATAPSGSHKRSFARARSKAATQ